MSNRQMVQIIGAVIDVEFPRMRSPKIYDALEDRPAPPDAGSAGSSWRRHRAHHRLGSSDGLKRGLIAHNTGAPSRCRWQATLGRIMNVLGEPIDEAGEVKASITGPSTAMRRV